MKHDTKCKTSKSMQAYQTVNLWSFSQLVPKIIFAEKLLLFRTKDLVFLPKNLLFQYKLGFLTEKVGFSVP